MIPLNSRIVLLTIAGGILGYGHFARVLTLARAAKSRGMEADIWCFMEQGCVADSASNGIPKHKLSLSNFYTQENQDWVAQCKSAELVVIDVSHPTIIAEVLRVEQIISEFRGSGAKMVVIDSPGNAALLTRLQRPHGVTFLMPYAGFFEAVPEGVQLVQGPEYAILDEAYREPPVREFRENANRVLITFGGSDPYGLTTVALQAINRLKRELEVHVAIGRGFSPMLREQIQEYSRKSCHRIELLDSPAHLRGEFLWCEIAISASGLTKYELAATGTPAILLSIDSLHHSLNQSFVQLQSVVDLGLCRDPAQIAEEAFALLSDRKKRAKLSSAGRSAIDGKGADRVLKAIGQIIHPTKNEDR